MKITLTYLIAPVGGGSNAIGLFKEFIPDTEIKMIGVEAGGICNKSNIKNKPGKHAARIDGGEPGILHGCYSYLIQDDHGQIKETHSISAGLDYPSIGPEHAYLHQIKRVKYTHASDKEALEGFKLLSQLEGIIPALESSHAIGYVIKNAKLFKAKDIIIINLSGRGDKDLDAVMPKLKNKIGMNMLLDPDKKSYLAYITAGFPDVDYTVDAALSLFNNGVDLLELGLPFTDPVADGPVIQQAHSHALDKKFKPQDYLNILKKYASNQKNQ